MQTTIRIANPEIGGKKYTSGKRALDYINQGRAVLLDDGTLFFGERRAPKEANDGSEYHWYVGESAGFAVQMAERCIQKR